MRSASCDVKSRFGLHPQSLVRALTGAGCFRLCLAFSAGRDPLGASLAATALVWISCAGSLVLLALLDWDVQQTHPGISSLSRRFSYGALAGSLLPMTASPRFFMVPGADPALAIALAGLALTLFSATLLEWLVRDIDVDGPLPCENVVIARLTALQEIVKGNPREAHARLA